MYNILLLYMIFAVYYRILQYTYMTNIILYIQQLVPGLEYAIMSGGDVAPLEEQAVTELHKLFRCGRQHTWGFLKKGDPQVTTG